MGHTMGTHFLAPMTEDQRNQATCQIGEQPEGGD